MSIGNIFSKLAAKSEEEKENFLALEINDDTVKAASWTVVRGKVEVLRLSAPEEWEKEEELLKAVDTAISFASETISPEPEKIIFGLPEDWVKGEGIIGPKKIILADICEKLNLKPVGFVVAVEALITYLKQQQGTPPSAVFVRVGETEIVVTLVQLGKIIGSQRVGRSQDLALDIKEGLARFKQSETLPARIILFDGLVDFEEAKQQIISYDWQANLPFLHFPKVESLEKDFVAEAIAIAGGSEVAKSLGFQIKESGKKEKWEDQSVQIKEEQEEDIGKRNMEKIKESENLPKASKQLDSFKPEELEAQDLGFVFGEDIKKIDKRGKTNKRSEKTEEEELSPKRPIVEFPQYGKKKITDYFYYFSYILTPIKILPKKGILIIFPFLLLIGLVIFVWFFLLRAEVTLYFSPQIIQKDQKIEVDAKANSLDEDQKIIPGQQVTIDVEGEKEGVASGEKLTGEKAKGMVTIYNKTKLDKKFVSGTVLVSDDNLKYILEEEVLVASSSTQSTAEGEVITWGKAQAKISASEVGSEFNTGADKTFTFKDYPASDFSAKSEEGLKGGSSKKVKIVTAKDREKLLEQLTKELEEKGIEKLKTENSQDKVILEDILKSKIISQKFDKKIDEEAEKFTLKLKINFTTLSYSKLDLNKVLEKQFAGSLPSGFILGQKEFETEIKSSKLVGDKAEVELVARVKLIPETDAESLSKNLLGKSINQARDYLLSLPNLKKAKIDIYPSLLGKLNTMPKKTSNIKINFQIE